MRNKINNKCFSKYNLGLKQDPKQSLNFTYNQIFKSLCAVNGDSGGVDMQCLSLNACHYIYFRSLNAVSFGLNQTSELK